MKVEIINVPDWAQSLCESVKVGDEIILRYKNLVIEITVSKTDEE